MATVCVMWYGGMHLILTVLIYVFLVNPEITQGPDDAAEMLGEEVTLSCTATGLPLPDITWSSPIDTPVQPSDDMIIDSTRQSQITVSNLQLSDFGMNTCTATNEFASDSETALLECKWIILSAASRCSYAFIHHTVFYCSKVTICLCSVQVLLKYLLHICM